MPAFDAKNQKAHLSNKKSYSEKNLHMQDFSLTLPRDLTKIDEDIEPFWNSLSMAIHYTLWQPHQIELPEPGSLSLNGSSNYRVGESNFWKNRIIPKRSSLVDPSLALGTCFCDVHNSIPKHLSLSLPASSTPTTEKEVEEYDKVTTAKKIRIYPENELLWFASLNLYRRAYNLTIEFMNKGRKPSSEFRTQICDWCKLECEEHDIAYNSNLIQSAYRKACDTRTAVIKKSRSILGEKASMSFMSRNAPQQYFVVSRLSANKQIFPRILKGCIWTEEVPEEAIGKTVIVTYTNGQWFASVNLNQSIEPTKSEALSIVALDPGVRTFQTAFSFSSAVSYGEGFVNDRLVPLMLELDSLLSTRDKLHREDKSKQWVKDRLKNINRRIHKVRARQQNLVADLHRRVAYDLVSNHDVILLPTFETKQMTKKSDETRKRFLRRKTVRGMLGLAHYKFKQTLKWMAKKYGKTVIDANESYTSKTLWDGSVLKCLGGKASILFQGKRVNRDIHGARNILIRFLTKVIDVLSPQGACSLNITKAGFCGFGVLK
jgi:IS605 OrfB family transposase